MLETTPKLTKHRLLWEACHQALARQKSALPLCRSKAWIERQSSPSVVHPIPPAQQLPELSLLFLKLEEVPVPKALNSALRSAKFCRISLLTCAEVQCVLFDPYLRLRENENCSGLRCSRAVFEPRRFPVEPAQTNLATRVNRRHPTTPEPHPGTPARLRLAKNQLPK